MILKLSSVLCWVWLCTFSRTKAVLNVDNTGTNEISISYNTTVLLDHTESNPIFKLGIGQATFEEHHGNFEISENISQEILLPNVTLDLNTPQEVRLTFSSYDGTVQLSYAIYEDVSQVDGGSVISFNSNIVDNNEGWNRMWFKTFAEADEKVFGGGEQYTYFNMRGYEYPIWTREQGVGRYGFGSDSNLTEAVGDYHTTYYPQASFFSSRKYFVIFDNLEYLVINFENEDRHDIYVHNTELSGFYLVADTIKDLVPRISKHIGLQPMLPDWVMTGIILGVQQGTDILNMRYQEAKDAGINVTAMWIQDWSGKTETSFGLRVYWHWKWNETYYPGLDDTIQNLLQENVKVAVYCNPHIIEGSEIFLEGDSLNHFLTDSNNKTFVQDFGGFMAATVDLLDPESKQWYKDTLKRNILDLGIASWMADFGEYTRLDMFSKNPSISQQVLHNSLPVAWAAANREFVEEDGALGEAMFFMRAGGRGASAHQVMAWAGDQNVDFSLTDGVGTTVVAALSLSLSGMGLTHFDIGGYTTQPPMVRTEELLLRSAEYAVFTPVMRTHEGNRPESNVQYYSSNETLQRFARLSQIHSMLLPYTKYLVQLNADEGVPVQLPMFYLYENDPNAWTVTYQYMYGSDMIVAPVINRGQEAVDIYIPEGDNAEWYDFWGRTGPDVGPQTKTVNTTLGCPVVFYRGDSNYAELFQQINQIYGDSC